MKSCAYPLLIFGLCFLTARASAGQIDKAQIDNFFSRLEKLVQSRDRSLYDSFFSPGLKVNVQSKGQVIRSLSLAELRSFNFQVWSQAEVYEYKHLGAPLVLAKGPTSAKVQLKSQESVRLPGQKKVTATEVAVYKLQLVKGSLQIVEIEMNQ